MSRTHLLSRAQFDALAAGDGGPDAVAVLRSAQLSRRILLVHAVAMVARQREPEIHDVGGIDESLAALATAHRHSQDAVAEVLLHPQVGAWAMRCLRQLEGARQPGRPLVANPGQIGAIAAAAALRAGYDCETRVWISDGTVMIPTFGLARVGGNAGWGRARVAAATGHLHIVAGDSSVTIRVDQPHHDSRWLPLRRLGSTAATPTIEFILDDIDPFRGIDDVFVPSPRLGSVDVETWQKLLDESWDLLTRHHGARAEAIAAGIRSLVPLQPGQPGREGWGEVSATSAEAFGAISLTRPRDPLALAAALVHEFQHAKLASLLDLLPLLGPGEPGEPGDSATEANLHYAPWRPDPRPLPGLFQGAYAYLGLTHFWNDHRRKVSGSAARIAHFEYARRRDEVRYAVGVLLASDRLTDMGVAFVVGMRRSLRRSPRTPVPAAEQALARDIAAWTRAIWRLRNVEPDPLRVAGWAGDWIAGRSCRHARQARQDMSLVRSSPRQATSEPLVGLAYLRLRAPERFDCSRTVPERLADQVTGASTADALLVAGDHSAAVAAYTAAIRETPDDVHPWSGLALALRHQRVATARILVARPEVVYALHREIRIRNGTTPDPLSLAAWLA